MVAEDLNKMRSKCIICSGNDSIDMIDGFCIHCQRTIKDAINPDYYKEGGLQPYEYIKMKLTPDQYQGWLLGDSLVYLSRFNFKHTNKIEDLKKARWFLDKLIETLEA